MDGFCHKKNGYTLVEVLVSVGILVIFLPFAASMLTNSRLLASYSKHKIQAAYAAKQIIETQRQIISKYFTTPIGPIAAGHSYTVLPNPSSVILDTKGSYTPPLDCTNSNFVCGTAVITVAPSVYTSTSGVSTSSTTTDHFTVTISWIEQILNLKVPMTVTYAADVVNDTIIN
jgi:prepilin-type N-terminal cleavage/methylation domain-containing protein